MDSPTINNDGTAQAKQMPAPATTGSMGPPQQRRVLGDMSPNVKLAQVDLIKSSKPLQGSPLKRSFTARAEDTLGLQYLKRRKLSTDKPLSQVIAEESRGQSQETSQMRSMFCNSLRAEGDDGMTSKPLLPSPPQHEAHGPSAIQDPQPSPTEPNTPSSPQSSASEEQSSSADRRSFSSLINYEPPSQTSAVVKQPASKAEILRLRLKVAMYKVETDQVDVPFDRLRVNSTELKSTSEAVEVALAQLRREAQEDLVRQRARIHQKQDRQVAGILQPVSAFWATDCEITEPLVPSSPPRCHPLEWRAAREVGGVTPQRSYISRLDEANLTSSVVKGRVAEDLLGLRNAA